MKLSLQNEKCVTWHSVKYLHQNRGVHQAGSVWLEGFSEAFQHSWFSSLHLSYTVEDTRLLATKRPQHIVLFQKYCIAPKGQNEHQPITSSRTTGISLPTNMKDQTKEVATVLPSFHFGEVNCYKSIWKCFFIQVSAVSPYEGRHIIA